MHVVDKSVSELLYLGSFLAVCKIAKTFGAQPTTPKSTGREAGFEELFPQFETSSSSSTGGTVIPAHTPFSALVFTNRPTPHRRSAGRSGSRCRL